MNKWQRQSHDVEVISFDLRNVYTGIALNGIRTRLVVNVSAAYVIEDLPVSQRGKPNSRAFQTFESLFLGLVYEGNGRQDQMITTGEFSEHSHGVCLVNRLSENFVVDSDHSIGRKNRGLGDTRCYFHSLFPGYAHDEGLGIFVAGRNLVDGRWHNGKRIAEDCESLLPARRV